MAEGQLSQSRLLYDEPQVRTRCGCDSNCLNAWANAGTPLLIAVGFHLVVGNFITAIVESAILALFFRRDLLQAFVLMVPANFISTFVGFFFSPVIPTPHITLENYYTKMGQLILVYYVLTILVEYPLVLALFSRTNRRWLKALLACAVIQTVSYTGLFYWYSNAPPDDFGGRHIVDIERMTFSEDIVVYYLGVDDGNVYRQRLGSAERTKVGSVHPEYDRLTAVRKRGDSKEQWSIHAAHGWGVQPKTLFVLDLPEKAEGPVVGKWPDGESGGAPRLGDASESRWHFSGGGPMWLSAMEDQTRYREWGMETLFVQWWVSNVMQLPNDTVILQLASDMIALFDPETEEIAFVAYGEAVETSDASDVSDVSDVTSGIGSNDTR